MAGADQLSPSHPVHDERAPLLARADEETNVVGVRRRTPLPRVQLATIYTIKLVVPVTNTQAFPYINKMVEGLIPAGASVGYYSGLLGLSMSVGHFLSIFFWGRLSDWIGRTPVLAIDMIGFAVSSLAFGLSTTFLQALGTRFLVGIFGGIIGVIHSVVGELSDTTNQATAFPLYDIIAAVGFIIGPVIGGTFAEPAIEMPRWFDTPFFRAYPYVLPCIITALFAIAAALLSGFYLRETHPHKVVANASTPVTSTSDYDAAILPLESSPPVYEKPPSLQSLLAIPVIRAICASQGMLGFLAACFNTGFVLMSYTPIEQGGLGMNPRSIAGALSIMGFVSIGLKLALPIFLHRYDALTVFRFTLITWPFTFAMMPLMNIIARHAGPQRSPSEEALLWIMISFVLFLSRLGCLAFSIVMILTKDHTPTSFALGTTNSISELAQMIGIAVGSPFISSLIAFSSTSGIAGGYLWVVVVCALSILGDFSASRIGKYRFASEYR